MTLATNGRRIRVLHLIAADHRRGAEMFAVQLAENLAPDSFESALCIVTATGGGLPHDGLATYRLMVGEGRLRWRLIDIPVMARLRGFLGEFSPDVLLAHGSITLQYGALARVVRRVPVGIYKNIGIPSTLARTPLRNYASRVFLRGFDAVVSFATRTRDEFVRVFRVPSERVAIIPNGVDVTPFDAASRPGVRAKYRKMLGLSDQKVALVSVGSLSPEKNHQELLSLMRDAKGEGLPAHLLIVGDGPLRRELEQEAGASGIRDSVHFMGVRDDVPAILAASDIFLLPSKLEGMPRALIEAGLAGLSSVAYDVAAVSDVVENGRTGFVVPQGDYEGFKSAAFLLMRDQAQRLSMGSAAWSDCREKFDIRRTADAYAHLMHSLLAGRSKGK